MKTETRQCRWVCDNCNFVEHTEDSYCAPPTWCQVDIKIADKKWNRTEINYHFCHACVAKTNPAKPSFVAFIKSFLPESTKS